MTEKATIGSVGFTLGEIPSLEHKESSHYLSAIATSVLISGPTPDGLFHFHFSRDRVVINREVPVQGDVLPSGARALAFNIRAEDTALIREDIATISMTKDVFLRVASLIENNANALIPKKA